MSVQAVYREKDERKEGRREEEKQLKERRVEGNEEEETEIY